MDVKNIAEISRCGFVDSSVTGYTSSVNNKQIGSVAMAGDNTNNNPTMGQSPGNREIDQALVERAQRGDQQAFGMLVEKYQRKLGRLL